MRDSGQPKSRFAERLNKIGNSLLKLFGGDFLVFLLFLVITFFFWWSQTMNQDYEATMRIPLQIKDVPDDVRITFQSVDQLTVSLNGKGRLLRKSGRRGGRHTLMVSSSAFNVSQGHASLSTQRLRDSVSAFLHPGVSIRSFEPDSLVYQYVRQRSVMLPVVFDGTTGSQDQFFMENIVFEPDSVRVNLVLSDTVTNCVYADAGMVMLSSDTTVRKVALRPIPDAVLSRDDVQMTVVAQQYTEKSLEVPIKGVNFPNYLTLKSFPSKAVVTAWVKMSEYDKVVASDFQVVVDFNDISGRESSKAPLRVFSQPANVRNVRLQTRTVDYLMENKLF